ncbi:hypothetical protein O1D55_003087 [Vibrio cholerae]|nr:hypothetical protein [Vibrio cholerae]EKF9298853.1 hypothetical protein [Vibrio cholerae]EKF9936918.1 hypothetical protein [Vibrio cholerae]EMC2457679.1 hypothetical protein [Vibrio cholerae]
MRIKFKQYNVLFLFLFSNIIVLVFSILNFHLVVFELGEKDGFYKQIQGVLNSSEHALSIYHYFRYIIIYPFIFIEDNFGSLALALVFMNLYILSITVLWVRIKWFSVFSFLIIIMPYFFSIRTSLCIMSVLVAYSYLYYGDKYNKFILAISIVMANLSSGVLINVLLLFLYKMYQSNKKLVIFLLPVFLFSLFPMFISKLDFFSSFGNPFLSMIMRNNILSSIGVSDYKFVFYILLLVFYVLSSFYFFSKNTLNFFVSFLGVISLVLFEGLGAISMSALIIFIFFSRVKITKL